MSNEASKTKGKFGSLEKKILVGKGIDIGCGRDPIYPDVRPFDIENGDANVISKFVDEKFDYIFSSHCLEHMYDPYKAIQEWWKIIKDGGYLYVAVPDEDLYEQGVFPSRWNPDHKCTFTIYKKNSWSPVSVNIIDLLKSLPNAKIIKIELQDDGYDYSLKNIDQTFQKNNRGAMAQIIFVAQKNSRDSVRHGKKCIFMNIIKYNALHLMRILYLKNKFIFIKNKLSSKKYTGVQGKIFFVCKGIRFILNKLLPIQIIVFSEKVALYGIRIFLNIYSHSEKIKKEIVILQPNGLGDAIINKCYIEYLLRVKNIQKNDILIIASTSWKEFSNIIYPKYNFIFINNDNFEKKLSYRISIYKMLSKYNFNYILCNLRWHPVSGVKEIVSFTKAQHKYIHIYSNKSYALNKKIKQWCKYFSVNTLDYNNINKEISRIAIFYNTIFGNFRTDNLRTVLQRPKIDNPIFKEYTNYIAMHIGNAEKNRRWKIENFMAVANYFSQLGYKIVILGGKLEIDLEPHIDNKYICRIGVLTAEEYTTVVADAKGFLAGDTGPAHLATALNTSTVVLLGGGHFESYFPYPDEIYPPVQNLRYVFHKMNCYGCNWECSKKGTPHALACIHEINPDKVIKALHDIL